MTIIVSNKAAADRTASEPDPRWAAVLARDGAHDGEFVYAVRTTGVFCRPSCPSRGAKRQNVAFYPDAAAAEAAGFRACRRCHPKHRSPAQANAEIMAEACRLIEAAQTPLTLAALARASGLSPHYFHRQFKAATGLTPRAYAAAHRARRIRAELAAPGASVTGAIYEAGYSSSSRFYETANAVLGMTPTDFKRRGRDVTIRFAVGQCSLGAILVAQSEKGVCAITLGDDPADLVRDLEDRFPDAALIGADSGFEAQVAEVVGFVEAPRLGLDLPLDIRGTAFQERVWQALRTLKPGETASYSDIAARIGAPNATRAVAGACAANPIAIAIPCHRVVRADGALSGYRWGIERKRALLEREAAGA